MGSIRSSIELQDHFTHILMNVINAVNMSVSAMEQMQSAMNEPIDTASFQGIQEQLGQATQAMQELNEAIEDTEGHIQDNVNEQERFNQELEGGVDSSADLRDTIASAVGAYAGIAGLRKAKEWIEDCTAAFDTQFNAETQLISVLASMLDEEYVAQFEVETAAVDEINALQGRIDEVAVPVTAETRALTAAYDQITAKASEIQSRGIYGDETMIAAAAEFSTYFTDTDAIEMMMDTLADYAIGMSGGGAIDSAGMVDYATNLGKIMSGAYDAMTKKGFEFTDSQKAIIEGEATREQIISALGEEYLDMSSDMQAAAAITQVIDEAWSGLYESMSNTPEGKIIQMTNTWGDMKEVIGGQLYPYVLLFVDAITSHWGTIQSLLDGITLGLQFMMGVLSWLTEGAFNFAQVIIDNWGWISPIIYGIIGALAVYGAYLSITKGLELGSVAAKGLMAVWEGIHAAAICATTGATWAEVTAQNGLNAAMYACPLVWIIILIIALIALFYAAVAAVNKFAGTSVSATGTICGAFMFVLAAICNIFVALWNLVVDVFVLIYNLVAEVANFIGNVFNDPIGAVCRLFFSLADTVLGILEALASAIDALFGSNLAGAVAGWRDSLGGWVDETFGQGEEIMAKINADDMKVGRFDPFAAWDAGRSFGEGIDESIANFDLSSLFGTTDIPSADDYASALTAGGIGSGIDDIAGNTGAMADAMDITGEELKYLRDIAEQEAVNRFTTAEISIEQTNHNTIKNGMDLDGIMSGMTDMMNEAIDISTEGVHD